MVNFEKWLQFFKKCSHVTVIFDEFWPQLSTFCSHISNYDCNFQHFAVIFRIMTATFYILRSHFELWLQLSNYDCKMLKIAVTWLQISKLAVRFRIMTATFNILQSHFELWLQLSTFCSHISNYDCNFQHFAVTFRIMTAKCWKLQSRDCRFQFAVIIRNVTAKCWKLQS